MAQKVSPISLRISNKIVWNSIWSEYNKSYSHFLFKDIEIKNSIKLLASFIGVKANHTLIKPQNGSINLHLKRVAQSTKKDPAVLKQLIFLKSFVLNVSNRSDNSLKYKKKVSLWESKLLFWYLPAQFFSDYIASQIRLSSKRRNEAFRLGVQSGIQSMLRYYFNKKSKFFVSGIKVSCKGKWIKTNTGRTQKINFNLGKLNNQSANSFMDYSLSTIVTKFGVCSIKVTLSYQKIKRRF